MNNNYFGGSQQSNPGAAMPNQYNAAGNPYMGGAPAGHSPRNMRTSSNGALPVGWILNGRYTILNILGKGAFSFVYLVFDGYSQAYRAIKELYVPGLCSRMTGSSFVGVSTVESQQQFGFLMARYQEEYAAVTSMANDSGVINYFDLFFENNTAYMVMEYIQGMSVRQLVESSGGMLNPFQVQQIMKDVLAALSSIHNCGYLHRDIKPENVIIMPDGSIKIIDFGAARLSASEQDDAELKYDKVFTQGYAPPEQFADSRRQGPETDVYAAGALCYYMLSGQVPYPSMDRKVSSYDPLKPLGMIRKDIPKYMIKAIDRAMELKPELRFRTAKSFSRCLCGKSTTKTAEQVKRSKLVRRTFFAAAVIAVLAFAASVAAKQLLPNPVRDLITGDASLTVMVPVAGDSSEAQQTMWKGIASDFSQYVLKNSGHTVELELIFAPAGTGYTQQLERYAEENPGPVVVVRDERFSPDIQPNNHLPDLSSLIDPTADILGFSSDKNTLSVPVSFDMPVLYTNGKLLSDSGHMGDLPDELSLIAEIQVGEGISPLLVDPLLRKDYSHAASFSNDPLGDFCAGKAMCYIGFAGDFEAVEQALPGYCTISPIPENDLTEAVYTCEWGVIGDADQDELNAAQVFLGYICDEGVQETLCIRNDGGFPANDIILKEYLDYYPRFESLFHNE